MTIVNAKVKTDQFRMGISLLIHADESGVKHNGYFWFENWEKFHPPIRDGHSRYAVKAEKD